MGRQGSGARAGGCFSTLPAPPPPHLACCPTHTLCPLRHSNDVCNGHPDTIAHMTTPQAMRDAALDTMAYLDTRLPKGSNVYLTGLANGQ